MNTYIDNALLLSVASVGCQLCKEQLFWSKRKQNKSQKEGIFHQSRNNIANHEMEQILHHQT
jgi:hypothetical protein